MGSYCSLCVRYRSILQSIRSVSALEFVRVGKVVFELGTNFSNLPFMIDLQEKGLSCSSQRWIRKRFVDNKDVINNW